ncbi:MAG: CaiB/BaiF CoA transferase family protein [Desulfomonilaceae bacterium]
MSSALSGLKVLDLTMNLPGPYMTWLLAALGTEIIKIENPVGGDYARVLGGTDAGSQNPFFEAINRNKKSATLNLKNPEGRRLFLSLLNEHDILVEGFRPGTMERLGLGFETTRKAQPRLIQVSISGYGQDGPYRLRAGHDLNYLSLAGVIGMTGTRDGQAAIPGVQIADLAAGSLMALSGLLAAVIQRQSTGQGQYVDISMFHGSLSLATMVFAGIQAGLEEPEPGKMLLNGRFPCYGLYRTLDGRHMSLGCIESKFWQNFCAAVGRPDLAGHQFGAPDIVKEVENIFAARTQEQWIQLMKDHDACCEPVLSINDAVESDLVKARKMLNSGPGGNRYLAPPFRLSESTMVNDVPAPALGQHTREILSRLNVSDDELQRLSREGVI